MSPKSLTAPPKPPNPDQRDILIDEFITATGAKAVAQSAQKATNISLGELFLLPPEGVQLESVEMNLVEQAMKRSGGNQTRAAELLGISRDQLRYRLKKLDEAAVT